MSSFTDSLHTILNRSVDVPQEQLGSNHLTIEAAYTVQNRLQRIVIAVCCLALAGLSAAVVKLAMREPERIVVRVDQNGAPTVAPYASLMYQPREAEIRHFLIRFVQDEYSKTRATYRESFQRKLYFLEQRLAGAAMQEESRTKGIVTFLQSGDDNVEAFVTNVSIEDMRGPEYKASVDFERVYRSVTDGRETKREKLTGHFVFKLLDRVRNEFIPVNPLGLVITYYRSDTAF